MSSTIRSRKIRNTQTKKTDASLTPHTSENQPFTLQKISSIRGTSSPRFGSIYASVLTFITLIILLLYSNSEWNKLSYNHRKLSKSKLSTKKILKKLKVIVREKNEQKGTPQLSTIIQTNKLYNVAVIGSGPAGLTAALFASRSGLSTIVLGSINAGSLSQTQHLDNFPTFTGDGSTWLEQSKQQALSFGAYFMPSGVLVKKMSLKDDILTLETNSLKSDKIQAQSVIIATGANPRQLKLPHEDKLWGRTLHSCAVCDGHLYKNKVVLVVGGGDSALDAAIILSRFASKVYLVHRRLEFSAKNYHFVEMVKKSDNVEILTPFTVSEWKLDTTAKLEAVKLTHSSTKEEKVLKINGAFVMIGAIPNTSWLNGSVELTKEGLIQLEEGSLTSTSLPGVFATGEVCDGIYKQAITASASGAQAAMDVEKWLRINANIEKHTYQVEEKQSTKDRNLLPSSIECDLTEKSCIYEVIRSHPIVIFSKPWCSYCKKAIDALSLAGISNPFIVDLTKYESEQDIQDTLEEMTGRRTVPNVFIKGTSVGGGDETSEMQERGELASLLQSYNLIPKLTEETRKGVESEIIEDEGDSSEEETESSEDEADDNEDEGDSEDEFESGDETESFGKEASQNEDIKASAEEENLAVGMTENSKGKDCNLAKKDCIQSLIEKYPVLIFSASTCPKCKKMKEFLENLGVVKSPHIIDIRDYGYLSQTIMSHVMSISGWGGIPNLFINGKHFGGYSQMIDKYEQGELIPALKAVGFITKEKKEICDMTELSCIEKIIKYYPAVMFSLKKCHECKVLKEWLVRNGAKTPHIINMSDYYAIDPIVRQHLVAISGRGSMPNLFIDERHFGGYGQTLEMHHEGILMDTLDKMNWLRDS